MATREEIGKTLKAAIKAQGMTQAQFAEHNGFALPTLLAWLAGETAPRKATALTLARMLGLDADQVTCTVPKGEGRHPRSQVKAAKLAVVADGEREKRGRCRRADPRKYGDYCSLKGGSCLFGEAHEACPEYAVQTLEWARKGLAETVEAIGMGTGSPVAHNYRW